MRQPIIYIIAIILIGAAVAYAAEPTVSISPKWTEIRPGTNDCGGFSDDKLILKIKAKRKEITHEFCSSYGKAEAKIVQDADGKDFLVLKYGIGRGTNARSEYLSIYPVHENLVEYVRIPISEGSGFTSRWFYDYKINKPKQGGLSIDLTLRIEGTDADWYPNEKTRTISIK